MAAVEKDANKEAEDPYTRYIRAITDRRNDRLERAIRSPEVTQDRLNIGLHLTFQQMYTEKRPLQDMLPLMDTLLRAGAVYDGSVPFRANQTPYHIICAAPGDVSEILERILNTSKGCRINQKDDWGKTALLYAQEKNNEKCYLALEKHGAVHDK